MKCPQCKEMNNFEVHVSDKALSFPDDKVNKRWLICKGCGLNFETTEIVEQASFRWPCLDPSNEKNINFKFKEQIELFETKIEKQ